MLLEQVPNNSDEVYFYHHDQLGSVRALTNSSGVVQNSYEYDAYGKVTASTGSVYNPFGYAGEYTDAESGLIYLRARYYDPGTQQFLTRDPEEGTTGQAYAYAGGSPTNARDPSGRLFWFIIGALALGIGGNMATDVGIEYLFAPDEANFDWGGAAGNAAGNPLNYLVIPGPSQGVKAFRIGGRVLSGSDSAIVSFSDNVAGGVCRVDDAVGASDEIIYRGATYRESVKRLSEQAQASLNNPLEGIHGISASADYYKLDPGRGAIRQAPRSEIEKHFVVHNTPFPDDPLHRTIELPNPVTNEVADLLCKVQNYLT